MPLIQSSDSLPNFLHTLFCPKVSITTALYCHPSTYRLFYCESAVARAARAAQRPSRSAHIRPPCATQTGFTQSDSVPAGGQVIQPQRPSICHPSQRLPPDLRNRSTYLLQARSARLSALIATPAPAPVLPQPLPMWAAPPTLQFQCKHAVVDPALPDPTPLALGGKPLTLLSVQHRRPWTKSHCLFLPPSLPPAPLRPSSAGLALLRRPAPASPSSAGPRLPRPPPPARVCGGLALLRRPAQARAGLARLFLVKELSQHRCDMTRAWHVSLLGRHNRLRRSQNVVSSPS